MIKTEIKAHRIFVDSIVNDTENRATLICITYRISYDQNHYAAEFTELVSNFDNSQFVIPNWGHTFSFQEEIRIFSTAAALVPNNRQNIEDWLTLKMKEVYGQECEVTVEEIV